jgi:hypothetical protein
MLLTCIWDACPPACCPPQVLGQISRFVARVGSRTRVLLLPSTRDLHHHPVLPQPPLPEGQARSAGVTSLANPSTLRCNEVVVGVCAADWLMACNREEVARSTQPQDRLPELAALLPAQQSYMPLFPAPLGTPLDCSKAATALHMPYAPDLLLVPSDLAPFAKLCPLHQLEGAPAAAARAALAAASGNAQPAAAAQAQATYVPDCSAVCINPGRLAKGASGGAARSHGPVGTVTLPRPKALTQSCTLHPSRWHLCRHPNPAAGGGSQRGSGSTSSHQCACAASAEQPLPCGHQAYLIDDSVK